MAKKTTAKKVAKTELTPEDAQKLLKVEQIKLVKKSKDPNKTLTASERKYLEQLASKEVTSDELPRYVTTKRALYQRLNISETTLQEWHKIYAHELPKTTRNGAYDVDAWKAWIEKKGLLQQGKSLDSRINAARGESNPDEESLDEIKKRKEKAMADEREVKVAILKKDYLSREFVVEAYTRHINEVKKLLRDRFENELPAVTAGLDAPEIRSENQAAIDEVCMILSEMPIPIDSPEEEE